MLSIRAKLTLWYLGITALVLTSFAIAIYLYLSRGLLTVIDTSLHHQAERIARAVGFPLGDNEVEQPGAFMLAPQFVSIINKEGEVTDRIVDKEGREAPINRAAMERAARDWQPQYEEVA
ncbi:MAG TPA: hypothetical protein VNO70_24160, partial [Blastocatellia bacterium]|nr:hypothetical protein [Blastocatellia bacterium]